MVIYNTNQYINMAQIAEKYTAQIAAKYTPYICVTITNGLNPYKKCKRFNTIDETINYLKETEKSLMCKDYIAKSKIFPISKYIPEFIANVMVMMKY